MWTAVLRSIAGVQRSTNQNNSGGGGGRTGRRARQGVPDHRANRIDTTEKEKWRSCSSRDGQDQRFRPERIAIKTARPSCWETNELARTTAHTDGLEKKKALGYFLLKIKKTQHTHTWHTHTHTLLDHFTLDLAEEETLFGSRDLRPRPFIYSFQRFFFFFYFFFLFLLRFFFFTLFFCFSVSYFHQSAPPLFFHFPQQQHPNFSSRPLTKKKKVWNNDADSGNKKPQLTTRTRINWKKK